MQSRPLLVLRQGDLVRLRNARRFRPGRLPSRRALHLPLTLVRTPHPRRRTVVAALLVPALFPFLLGAGGGWAPDEPLWTALVALASLLGAGTLASYVPLPGERVRSVVGCSPCAAVSAFTVLGSALLLGSGPHQASLALVAAGLAAFGLFQRRTGAGSDCPVP